jgi:hypothetical protein
MGLKYNHPWEECESIKQREREVNSYAESREFLHAYFGKLEESEVLGREPVMLCLKEVIVSLCFMLEMWHVCL